MPIPLPDLDDRTFADLLAEARALLPVLHPDWTDHNPSDPGIVLIELLAWLTEMLLFKVNQIPEATTHQFLTLLNGPVTGNLDTAIRNTMRALHERYRAVTPEDYEYLVREIWPHCPENTTGCAVARVRCFPGLNLSNKANPRANAPAHVSVVVVPITAQGSCPQPTPDLLNALSSFLDKRRILTTRHHVVEPSYVKIKITADLALREDSPPDRALTDVENRLREFFNPLRGGPTRDGWPFGQHVYASQIYTVLEQVALIDYAEKVHLTSPLHPQHPNQEDSITLAPHQLVCLTELNLKGYDSSGRPHPRTWPATS